MATKPLISDYLVPPGHYVREALEHYGMNQTELASRMGRPPQAISEIINGKKEVTEETAFELENVLGTPAHVWLNLEKTYRYGLEREHRGERLAEQTNLLQEFPYNDLRRLGYVRETRDHNERVEELLNFLGVAHLSLVEKSYAAAFRKAPKKQPSPHALAAWLRIGAKLADAQELGEFDKAEIKRAIPALRQATKTEGEIDGVIQALLGPAGVAFATAPHLPKTFANGATFWHGRHPVLLLSVRGGYEDIVWFTLFHEIGHILLHDRSETFIEGLGATSKEESEADRFACDTLIPPTEWSRFAGRHDFSPEAVAAFADQLEISPAIVVGRLMHDHGAFGGFHHLRHLRGKMTFDSE